MTIQEQLAACSEQVARLRRALEFYAHRPRNKDFPEHCYDASCGACVERPIGKTAREALSATPEPRMLSESDADCIHIMAQQGLNLSKAHAELKAAREGLKFYSGGNDSDLDLDIFDYFECKCGTSAAKEVRFDRLANPARKALTRIDAFLKELE